ncbi:Putative phosphatase YwpJ [Candidatus Izimaplasma bacterium HR1]|jgi:Cof subfamily protein (haloacid dehalogenase superfamily)|uniref:Cof-type HAD-IIB family hydrolase n=1 Tax=Candidatus Izimoplasma sp. HR1 TaxID=1541959 RepID=UPI0004F886E0|nr:Putative phosphatase YwpJ [Candidatus Izimaplasma bacterium HR1]
MIKMVVSDMDGTLLNSNLEISQKNLDAIEGLREKGIRFCIATGRPEQLVKEYIEPLNMKDPMIMYNGSVIGHPFQDEKLYDLKLEKKDIKEIIEYCELNDIIYMPYTKDMIISKPNYRVEFFQNRNEKLADKNKCIFEDIRDIDDIVNNHSINKVLLIENDQEKFEKTKELVANYSQFEIASSQKGFIDINPRGASKGNALKVLAKHFGYTLDEIVVFGDQDNDVSMLEVAGVSVAMANASENAKNAADHITSSNNDSGVAEWINKNLLK